MDNPFDNPTTIRNPARFIGREAELERIFGRIKDGQNTKLFGPRRIGKTSLLNCLSNEAIQQRFRFDGSSFLFLYLDLQRFAMKTRDLFEDMNLVLKQKSLEYREEEGIRKDDEFISLVSGFHQRGLHPVLIVDAFDEIAQYEQIDLSVFSFLRAECGSGRISCITASVQPLEDIFNKLNPKYSSMVSPFTNILGSIRLSPFKPSEAHTLLTRLSESEGLPFTPQEVRWIVEMAGYHPYLLQQVAAVLFEEKRARGLSENSFQFVKKEVQQNLYSHFEDCWNTLDNDGRLQLIHFESRWSGLSKNERQRLVHEILEEARGEIFYPELSFSTLFYDHLRHTGELKAAPVIEIDLDEFKKILSAFNDLKALGESTLTRVPFIAAQIKQQGAISSMMKGRIVQESLKKALERMGGQEKRTDVARDWAYYNALYYRYFARQKFLTQEAIAQRLAMSTRHYYRLLSDAADRLWHTLQEMEEGARSEPGV